MNWRKSIAALSVTTLLVGFSVIGSERASADTTPLKIMPLGDSLTEGYGNFVGGYRVDLYTKLINAGINFDFVGSASGGPSTLPDKNHQGMVGWRIDELISKPDWGTTIEGWLNTYQPDMVLLQAGTNDVNQNYDYATCWSRLNDLIDRIIANRPNAYIVVSTIPNDGYFAYNDRAAVYNAGIPDIVYKKASQGKKIYLVDNFNAGTIYPDDFGYGDGWQDQVHFNWNGYAKHANNWFAKIQNILQPSDFTAPSTPQPLWAASKTNTSVTLNWSASSDNVKVDHYEIYQNTATGPVYAGHSYTNAVTLTGLTADTAYQFEIKAYDAEGNASAASYWLSVTTNATADTVNLFSDNFNDRYADGWKTSEGQWIVNNGEYVKSTGDSGRAIIGDYAWANYAVQGTVVPSNSKSSVGILGRVQSNDNSLFYQLDLNTDGTTKKWSIKKFTGLFSSTTLASGTYTYTGGTPYLLKLSMNGSTLSASISTDNGLNYSPLGSATDSAYTAGKAGVRTDGTGSHFDNFKVTAN
ncbi:GDSL-type esterase/lipase family protein [Paenibacillus roseipurpureus]|uniref:GDSL-type esterase/lipase family protein n=1 Tax=Paenibacillus roseopurpureus TaxID=2918901 RepID=A0AA96LTY8_9BACL|nr:GDSL-type esterase/lipase family protein [Paenibacillus sp. MBLB1832]WNR45988.1 GDSL-type esterase/lipase family protein [Paenibacillus sp. MBLB1832]